MEGNELAKIGIGEVQCDHCGNIMRPFRNCYVITTAGQIWDIKVDAFGANETNLRALWKTNKQLFIKR